MIFGTRPHFLLAFLGCAAAPIAHADNRADGLWRGTAGAALSLSTGNTDSTSLALDTAMSNATAADKLSLGGHLDYGRGKADGLTTTTSDKWDAFGQYDLNLSPRVYAFGKLALEADRLAELDLRAGADAGAGYKLVNTPETLFNVFAGAGYSSDKYSQVQTIGQRSSERFSRSNLVFGEESSHQLSASTTFKQHLEVAPGVSGDKAMLSKFSAGLAVAMTRTLSLAVNLRDTFNDRPPDGQKKNDLSLFTGINFKFGAN